MKAGAWYVAARLTGQTEVRTYRLASINALVAQGRPFRRPKGFALDAWWRSASATFEAQLRQLTARLRVSPRGLKRLRNARLAFTPIPGNRPGPWTEGLVALESAEQGALQLLAFGVELQVLEPETLRLEMQRVALAVLQLHTPEQRSKRTQAQASATTPEKTPTGRKRRQTVSSKAS